MQLLFLLAGVVLGAGDASIFGAACGAVIGFYIGHRLEQWQKNALRSQAQALRAEFNQRLAQLSAKPQINAVVDKAIEDAPPSIHASNTTEINTALAVNDESSLNDLAALSHRHTLSAAPLASPAQARAEVFDTDQIAVTKPAVPFSPAASPKLSPNDKPLGTSLFGTNPIVRLGLLILFLGLAFLATYAANQGLLPLPLRLAFIGGAGAALLAVGLRLRHKRPDFALWVQGGGVGVMYLTVFAAMRFYGLLGAGGAFAAMLACCILAVSLALKQNAFVLAFAAFAGGFATPLLISTGQGNAAILFAYYALLNLAVLWIAYHRAWRWLNALAFVFTFLVAGGWGVLRYSPSEFLMSQSFLIVFILIFTAASIFYARQLPSSFGFTVDSLLVFGTPLAGFALQAGLVAHLPQGQAIAALSFAAFYTLLSAVLSRKNEAGYALLTQANHALAVGFATLAVPLAFDAKVTLSVWALEGLAAFWVGIRQARWMLRAFGLGLQALAAVCYFSFIFTPLREQVLISSAGLGALLLLVPAFVLAHWLGKPMAHIGSSRAKKYVALELGLAPWFFAYAVVLSGVNAQIEIAAYLDAMLKANFIMPSVATQKILWTLLAFSLIGLLSSIYAKLTRYSFAIYAGYLSLLWPTVAYIEIFSSGLSFLSQPFAALLAALLALHYVTLRLLDSFASASAQGLRSVIHTLGAGLVWLIGLGALIRDFPSGNVSYLLFALWTLACLAFVSLIAPRLQAFTKAYLLRAGAVFALFSVVFGGLSALHLHGGEAWRYLPLLNAVDLSLALTLFLLWYWLKIIHRSNLAPSFLQGTASYALLGSLAFLAINTAWLRVVHHALGVPWQRSALFNSAWVQTGYAILWSLLALGLMLWARRRDARQAWLAGAGLLGLVVAKLFLFDLANAGSAERIIAFLGVGVLMLFIGYFAPLPPKAQVKN